MKGIAQLVFDILTLKNTKISFFKAFFLDYFVFFLFFELKYFQRERILISEIFKTTSLWLVLKQKLLKIGIEYIFFDKRVFKNLRIENVPGMLIQILKADDLNFLQKYSMNMVKIP